MIFVGLFRINLLINCRKFDNNGLAFAKVTQKELGSRVYETPCRCYAIKSYGDHYNHIPHASAPATITKRRFSRALNVQ